MINQLTTTRASRALAAIGLPFPQFVLLNHFGWRPREAKTVSGVASAMQQPQPGVTKTIQKMLKGGILRAAPSKDDARVKLIYVTPKGLRMQKRALAALEPAFQGAFAGWQAEELEALFQHLDRLKVWLDTEGRKEL